MKHFLLSILIIFSLKAHPQSEDPFSSGDSETSTFNFTQIVKTDSTLSKLDLYARARQWFADNFVRANNVLQMDNKEFGILIGHGNIPVSVTPPIGFTQKVGIVNFSLTISVKDGRFRIEMKDFIHDGSSSPVHNLGSGGNLNNSIPECGRFQLSMMYWRQIKEQAFQTAKNTFASITDAMGKPAQASDW